MSGNFLFLTRTKRKDYVLRKNNGDYADDNDEKFFNYIKKSSGIKGTENPFALLIKSEGKFFVMSGGIQTGLKDYSGTRVRLTFVMNADEDDAGKIFMHIVNGWEEIEKIMRSCLDVKAFDEDKIIFDFYKFTEALKDYDNEISPLPSGSNLKWEKSSNKIIPVKSPKKKKVKKYIFAAVLIFIFSAMIIFANYPRDTVNNNNYETSTDYESVRWNIYDILWNMKNELESAGNEYNEAFNKIKEITRAGGNITRSDLENLNLLMPERDRAKEKLNKISADITYIMSLSEDLGVSSNDPEKVTSIDEKIKKIKAEK